MNPLIVLNLRSYTRFRLQLHTEQVDAEEASQHMYHETNNTPN
jgi:hypothetical protein